MDDINMPCFYVLSRDLPKEHVRPIVDALKITPVNVAIISRTEDAALALEICTSLLRVVNDEAALKMAFDISQECDRPVVIGEAHILDAIYPDGEKEPVACSC